jgi:hypothetical protein
MAEVTFLQSPILTNFVYPFLLIFFIIFAILEKTKIFGEGRKQINALISFVISFIFVSAIFPKEMVSHLILFLTIAIVIVFVVLLIWGFIMGEKGVNIFDESPKGVKWAIAIFILIVVAIAVLWAAGIDTAGFIDRVFHSTWSNTLWTNLIFIVLVAAALAIVLSTGGKK